MHDVAPAERRSRWRAWLVASSVLLAVGVGAIIYLSRPPRATHLLLGAVGNALGLQVTAEGGSYRLRGTPQLDVHGLVARESGATHPLLRADRIVLSLPWSTIRSRGGDLTIDRIELERPVFDLAALQHWLQHRPPGRTRIPVLTHGLHMREGRLVADAWSVDAITLDVPTLAPKRPVAARVAGRFRNDALQLPFSLDVALTTPANDASIGVAGRVEVVRDTWRLPADIVVSGTMRPGNDGWQLRHAKLRASARYRSQDSDVPFALGVAGNLHQGTQSTQLSPAAIAVRGQGLVPRLDVIGVVAFADSLHVGLAGTLAAWPSAWPPLPSPLDASRAPLSLRLDYVGRADMSGLATLHLARDDVRFDARLHPDDVALWVAANASNPLPPLDGHLMAPRLDVAGATLQGVDVTVDDPAVPSPSAQ